MFNHNITIREANGEEDAFFLARQWEHYFGVDYKSQIELPTDLFPIANWTLSEKQENNSIIDSFGIIAEHTPTANQSVRVGGGVALLLTQEQIIQELEFSDLNVQEITSKKNAFFILNVVDPDWRGKGIGAKILKRRLDWVIDSGAKIVFSYGWKRDCTNQESKPLFKDAGFTQIKEISSLYAKIDRQACPDCNIWPSDTNKCSCNGIIWAKKL